MSVLRKRWFNICFVLFITAMYATVLIVTSNHIEFNSILYHGDLEVFYLSKWANFLRNGNQKYIGYIFIVVSLIDVLLLIRRKDYDEYQENILVKVLCIMAISILILVPFFLICILSIPNGIIEYFLLLTVLQWSIVLFLDTYFIMKIIK